MCFTITGHTIEVVSLTYFSRFICILVLCDQLYSHSKHNHLFSDLSTLEGIMEKLCFWSVKIQVYRGQRDKPGKTTSSNLASVVWTWSASHCSWLVLSWIFITESRPVGRLSWALLRLPSQSSKPKPNGHSFALGGFRLYMWYDFDISASF